MNFMKELKVKLTNIAEEEDDYVDVKYEDVEPEYPRQHQQRDYTAYDDYADEDYEDDVKQIRPESNYEIILASPKSVDDAPDVVAGLRLNHVCIVNLEGIEISTAQRIADFLGGASFAMNGSIERINENIFVMAPLGVSIKDMIKPADKTPGSIFSWVSKAAARF